MPRIRCVNLGSAVLELNRRVDQWLWGLRSMSLTLSIHPVTDLGFADATKLDGSALKIDREALRLHLLEDRRLDDVGLEIVNPGESARVGVLFDVLEPRTKEPGTGGTDFPGVLGPYRAAGEGVTHVLRGAAVSVVDPLGMPGPGGKSLEMSGDAGHESPYGVLHHLVVVPKFATEVPRHLALNVARIASLKASTYLAATTIGRPGTSEETFDLGDPSSSDRRGLPNVAYIAQIHGHQRVVETDEHILYGSNTQGMMPTPLGPTEWLDGGILCSYWNMQVETYFYQNHPIILELIRRHEAKELNFVGTVATVAASDEDDRDRTSMMAARQAKWALGADGVVLTKYGGGAPHADMGKTAQQCESIGLKTTVLVTDMAGDRKAESALLFDHAEVDAIVYVGGNDISWPVQRVERVISSSEQVAASLSALETVQASTVAGVTNQQGVSRIRVNVY
jgi:hypothetical protein